MLRSNDAVTSEPIEIWKHIAQSDAQCWYLLHCTIKGLTTPAEYKKLSKQIEDRFSVDRQIPVTGPTENGRCYISTLGGVPHSTEASPAFRVIDNKGGLEFIIHAKRGLLNDYGSTAAVMYFGHRIFVVMRYSNGVLNDAVGGLAAVNIGLDIPMFEGHIRFSASAGLIDKVEVCRKKGGAMETIAGKIVDDHIVMEARPGPGVECPTTIKNIGAEISARAKKLIAMFDSVEGVTVDMLLKSDMAVFSNQLIHDLSQIIVAYIPVVNN